MFIAELIMSMVTTVTMLVFAISHCNEGEDLKRSNEDDYLLSFQAGEQECGYRNQKGDTVIPIGKYDWCFTDTFRTFAIVGIPYKGFVAIDRNENILYHIHNFDNGPDYPSEGLFRITQNGKFGFADSATGSIVVKPQFDAAFPFASGAAKVGDNCIRIADGEYHYWECKDWHYIDRTGRRINKPANAE